MERSSVRSAPLLKGSARLLVGLVAALVLSGCLRWLYQPPNPLSNRLTIEDEKEIGAKVQGQLREGQQLVSDPIVLSYLTAFGQKLVQVTEPQPFIYRFNIVRARGLNAFSVPGGYVYLHTDTLMGVGDEDELAGVLAHEIAHVRRRHLAKAREGNAWRNVAAFGLFAANPLVGLVAVAVNVSLEIKHTREHEAEADREAIDYMLRAGYDPDGMGHFFQRIEADRDRHPDKIPPYLYTHPAFEERIRAVSVQIEHAGPAGQHEGGGDAELREIQGRLAVVVERGRYARPLEFDRSVTDPSLREAREAAASGDLELADAILARAQQAESDDPRVALARAELAKRRDDFKGAAAHYKRAFGLDPTVPLVQYRLGMVHKRRGERSRAVFFLELAASRFRQGTRSRKRAEFEIEQLEFPLFEKSGLSVAAAKPMREVFSRGEPVVWWADISRHYAPRRPTLSVKWIDGQGEIVHEERFRMRISRRVSATLDSSALPPGDYKVSVLSGDSLAYERAFRIVPPSTASPGASAQD